jgi:excisionase family DNA binding protein
VTESSEFLDVEAAAALLGVKKATLYAYVSRGLLRSYKQGIGRKRLYRRDDIEALRAIQPSDAPAPPAAPRPSERPRTQEVSDGVLRDVNLPEAADWAGDH